ncbi:amino acid adenylation domain-containing protein [Sphingomonas sp. RHCKR7]|uniref:amino acid adenylation domain-containing protein n=1 Tax=Sphingomonas folli TaxID=2862497 RepID=UPI001CA4786F|nr:non-ribosomal peptide synthetase [Sphingomonas folli]MBW6528627.1 amino acid adenylation domain-containing protein [Sphingomonas folli]
MSSLSHAADRAPRARTLPLLAAQPGIWFGEQAAPSAHAYSVAHRVDITGPLEAERLARAIARTLDEVDSLHARFRMADDGAGPVQHLPVRPAAVTVDRLDCRGADDPVAFAEAAMRADLASAPAAESGEPLFRHMLLQLGPTRWAWYQRYHHLLVDGFGLATLTRRVAAHYEAAVTGRPVAPPRFADPALLLAEERAYRGSDAEARDAAYWRESVGAGTPMPSLAQRATDRLRQVANVDVRRATRRIDAAPLAALLAVGRGHRVGAAETAMAGVFAYLYRMTGATDLAVGVPLMRRLGSVAIDLVLPTVNVLPLRLRVEPADPFDALVGRVAEGLRAMRKHQRYGAEQLQRGLGLIGSGRALYGPTVNLKAYDPGATLRGVTSQTHVLAAGPIDDLEIGLWPEDDALVIELAAHPARYTATEVAAHADRLAAFLARLAAAPDRPVREVELATASERSAIARWSEGPVVPCPPGWTTVLDAWAASSARDPGAVALVHGDTVLTDADVRGRAARLARSLIARGIGPGDVVATALPRGAEAIVALLGVMTAGAAWMPLDLAYPAERLVALCADARPALILTDSTWRDPPPGAPLLALDDPAVREALAALPPTPVTDTERARPLAAADIAYVIYTSGTTGSPKGVMVPHRGLLNLLLHHRAGVYGTLAAARAPARVRAAHVTSLAFDASWEQIIWLLLGHELHLCDEEERRDAGALVDRVRAHRIDAIDLSPALLQQMLDRGLLDPGGQLGLVLVGGEAMPPALWQRLRSAPALAAINYYGPTEYSVDALGASVAVADTPVIGRPVANTRAEVLDPWLRRVPIGAVGELYVAGPGLATGYLGSPGLTAARFVADPFVSGGRIYRTGDRVSWTARGEIAFLGRGDQQVKVRGYRVEPGEVERAIAALPGVTGALVVAQPWGGSHRLLGYCTGVGEVADWRATLAATLPDHLIPAHVLLLDAWPLTANGKIDRAALPLPAVAGDDAGPVRYASAAEQAVCDAIAEVIGHVPVRPDADFFMLGGDSIGAMALATALRQRGHALRPRDVFAHRRADRIAAHLVPTSASTVGEEEAGGDLPPLPMLRWFETHHGLQTRFAHGVLVRVPAGIGAAAIDQAFAALARAHPVLTARTRAGGLTVPPPGGWRVPLTVLGGEPEEYDARFTAACARLNPAAGRMVEAMLWPGDGSPGRLMIVLHHLVTDGVSWRVLLSELGAAYSAAAAGATPIIAPEECGVRRWATLLHDQGVARRAELPLWRETLATAVPPLAAAPLEPARHRLGAARQRRWCLSASVTAALLERLPLACDATVEELLLAALLRAATSVLGAERLRVAMESHGRELAGVTLDPSRTIGWLTAEYPVLLEPAATPIAAVRSARQALRRLPDRGLGYGVLRWLDPVGEAVLTPLEAAARPEILLNYLGRFAAGAGCWTPVAAGGVFADAMAVDADPAMAMLHPLEINAFVEEGTTPRLAIHWTWADGPFDEVTVERLHAALGEAIETLAALPPPLAADTLVAADCPGLTAADLAALRARHGSPAAILPLLPLQHGLLYHAGLAEAASRYNSVTRLDLRGALDPARLRRALDDVLRRRPQLGARFDSGCASGPWQVLPLAPARWPLDSHDLSGLAGPAQAERLALIERDELDREVAIEGGLLVRAALIRLGDDRHRLLLNAHHLVVDGWSTPLLVRDVLDAYRAGAEALRPTAIPYPALVRRLVAQDPAPARVAWAEALAGARPTLLYGDAVAGATVRETELVVPAEIERALRARCREHGVTLNSVMQGAWGALLGVLTGRNDVLFGTPVSGRASAVDGVEEQIGLFSNTVPVRVALALDRPLLAQIVDLQARQGALLEHDGLSLAEIQQIAGAATLFDTLLVCENYPEDAALLARDHGGLRVTAIGNRGHTHYPLTIMVLPGERLRLLIEHRDPVVAPERLAARLLHLLRHLAVDTAVDWGLFDPRLPEDIALIEAANATNRALPDTDLRSLLVAQARRTPEALALVDAAHRLSYAQLRAQVVHWAGRLRAAGVGRGDVVAVALPRSARLAIALHAVIEAGAAYLPLDLDLPSARLATMVADARPRLIVTDRGSARRLPDAPRLWLDALAPVTEDMGEPAPLLPGDPAYLIYTSGSTGAPKAALISHRAIVNRLLWMQATYPIGAADRVLQKTPCGFDVSVWEFFWPLLSGAALVMAPPDAHRDPAALARSIAAERITTLHFVPSMLSLFLDWIAQEPEATATLRQVFASGESLPTSLAARHALLLPAAALHNLYGPTEAAIDVSYRAAATGSAGPGVPIGRPVWNMRLHVLDDWLRPVPVGVTGELYLAGVQLADHYLDRPALTATRFVADPSGDGTRLYRTGDLVRWTEAGEVEFLGRADDQLKIRGQRIELGEIEAALLEQEGVAAAAVQACPLGAARRGEEDARQIVGYVVPLRERATLDPALLRTALAERLPAAMVPAVIVALPALPLGATGKLDRRALPLPDLPASAGRAARPGLESQVAAAFARLLELPSVGAEEDFFALGGHSLLAMRLAAELRRALGRPLSVGQIMAAPTVARLAAALSESAGEGSRAGFGPVLHLRAGGGRPLFCVHPASGFAWQYSGLSRHLPAQLPLVGLQSPREGGAIATSADLDAACAHHLAAVRAIQPTGPYHLIGYSLGGTLAQGMAARLQAAGETVAFLGLFDTYPPEGQDWSGATDEEAAAEAERERAQFLAATEAERDAAEEAERAAMFAAIVANYADSVRLLATGRTPRFDGTATLFVATRTLPEGWDVTGCWAPFLAGLDMHRVDCRHEDMLSPATLATLAPALAARLAALTTLG